MKKINIIFALAPMFFSNISTAADFILSDLLLSGDALRVKQIIDTGDTEKAKKEDNLKLIKGVQELLRSKRGVGYNESGHDFLAKAIEKSSYNLSDYWDSKFRWDNKIVYQNNKLFDMERTMFFQDKTQLMNGKYGKLAVRSYHDTYQQNINTSENRLLNGIPAVGPDNKEILLCKLTPLSTAAYFEIASTDFEEVMRISTGNMTKESSCLHYFFAKDYWKKRHDQFIDYAYDSVKPKRNF